MRIITLTNYHFLVAQKTKKQKTRNKKGPYITKKPISCKNRNSWKVAGEWADSIKKDWTK